MGQFFLSQMERAENGPVGAQINAQNDKKNLSLKKSQCRKRHFGLPIFQMLENCFYKNTGKSLAKKRPLGLTKNVEKTEGRPLVKDFSKK